VFRWARRAATALGLIASTLALLEIGACALFERTAGVPLDRAALREERLARLAQLEALLERGEGSEPSASPHPYVGYIGRPGTPVRYFKLGDGAPVFNEYGMLSARERPFPSQTTKDELVIGVLGGSVAEIFANTQEEVLRQYIQRLVPGFDRDVVMISLGTGGWKQPQQLFHLEYALLLGFRFDAVVNLDGFNDLVFAALNAEDGIHPVFPSGYHMGFLYQLESRGALAPRTVDALQRLYAVQRREQTLLQIVETPGLRASALANLVGVVAMRRAVLRAQDIRFQATMEMPESVPPELRGPRRPWPEDPYRMAARVWRDASILLDAVCARHSIPYFHLLQPNQYVEGSKALTDEERTRAWRADHPWGRHVREGWASLRAAGEDLRKRGVRFYDLTMAFANRSDTLYLDDCCHFGRVGNEILAANLARILQQEMGPALAPGE
jgi:hypothetical protein